VIPALLDLPAHGFNLSTDSIHLPRLGLRRTELLSETLESVHEFDARRSEHLDVGVYPVDLLARRSHSTRLGLDVRRLFGQRGHLAFALGAGPGGGDGDRPQLVLRRDELLLQRDVRGGEPLVVDEEVLDVLVPRDEAPLDRRDGRVAREGDGRGGLVPRGRRRRPRRAAEERRGGAVQAYDVGCAPGCHRRRRLTSRRGDLVGLVPPRKQGRAKKVKQGGDEPDHFGLFRDLVTWA
jgi:hypothetical protein